MATIAIVQARMGSTRLPGKILRLLAGKPVLEHVIDRVRRTRNIERVVVATTTGSVDDAVEALCGRVGVGCFRGSENDVLDRYYRAAVTFGADPVVRITSDCPVIDPVVLEEVVAAYFEGDYDLFGLAGEFPDGLDCTLYRLSALERAWREATLPSEREHVGPYIENHPERFKVGGLRKFAGLSHHRWTLDEPRDLAFLEAVYARLYRPGEVFLTSDILALLEREPELQGINSDIVRNAGYLKSLREDAKVLGESAVTRQ